MDHPDERQVVAAEIQRLARECPIEDRAMSGRRPGGFALATDPNIVALSAALQAHGFKHLAKAVKCGTAWSRRLRELTSFDSIRYEEESAAGPGWSWNKA